jgi:hypothetical protein
MSANTSIASGNIDFAIYGQGFAATLASMFDLSDEGHAACPQEWRDLTALLHTLIEDEEMTTAAAAKAADVPESLVGEYRARVGI